MGRESSFKAVANKKDKRSMVITSDSKGNISFISHNVERICGYTPDEIVEGGIEFSTKRIIEEDIHRIKEAFSDVVLRGSDADFSFMFRKKCGDWTCLHYRSIFTYMSRGKLYIEGVISEQSRTFSDVDSYIKELI